MTEALEGFSPLTDAEKDAIWGVGVYAASAWGTDLNQYTTIKYNGNPCVELDGEAATLNTVGYAYDEQLSVGGAAVLRIWAAVYASVSADSFDFRIGLLRYDATGALVDAVSTLYATDTYEGAWFNLETTAAVGSAAFVRPFISFQGDAAFYVGMLDADIRYAAFRASESGATGFTSSSKLTFGTEHFDYGGVFDGSDDFTAPIAGLYVFTAWVWVELLAGEWAYLLSNAGGAQHFGNTVYAYADGDTPVITLSFVQELAAGDTVSVRFYHAGGGVARNASDRMFSGFFLR